jgi:CDP-glycerol glycerophosphotransferase (TagB/SpsB family)
LGYAALDRFAAFDTGKANIEAQQALRASGRDFVVLYTGMWNGHTQGLEAAAQACEILRDQRAVPVTLIAREHPRMRRDFPDAVAAWEQATNHYKVAAAILDTSAVLNTDYLIALAHVVVSTTSSTLMEASVLGRPNIAYLNPEILADYERDTHGLLKEFPLVTLGCTARAGNILELAGLIERALTDRSLGLEEAQRRVFRLDGKNAERCVEFLQGLLKR